MQTKTFDSKKDAEQWAAEIESKLGVSKFDKLQLKAAKTVTVRDLFKQYEIEVVPGMRGRNELSIVQRVIRDAAFMPILVTKITPQDIKNWRDNRAQEVQPQSVHRELNTISAVFSHAIKEWNTPIEVNPCHSVSRFKGADKPRDKRWNPDDVQKFLDAAGWKEDAPLKVGRDYVGWALLLGIETAMREGELCSLKVADFHKEGKYVFLAMTKNGDSRKVPLSTTAIRYLDALCKDKKPEDRIININANTLCEYVLEVRIKCGLRHLHFHDTRHEAATRLSAKLPNVLELSAVTGHRSLKSLQRYFNPTPSEIADKLG